MRMRQHLLNTHPICAGLGRRRAISLKEIAYVIVPMLGDVSPSRNAMRVNIKDADAYLFQLGGIQPGFLLNFSHSRSQRRFVAFLAVPARLQPASQLLMPVEKSEQVGWVNDEGGRRDVAVECVPAERRRLGGHKCQNRGKMACLGGIDRRMGPK